MDAPNSARENAIYGIFGPQQLADHRSVRGVAFDNHLEQLESTLNTPDQRYNPLPPVDINLNPPAQYWQHAYTHMPPPLPPPLPHQSYRPVNPAPAFELPVHHSIRAAMHDPYPTHYVSIPHVVSSFPALPRLPSISNHAHHKSVPSKVPAPAPKRRRNSHSLPRPVSQLSPPAAILLDASQNLPVPRALQPLIVPELPPSPSPQPPPKRPRGRPPTCLSATSAKAASKPAPKCTGRRATLRKKGAARDHVQRDTCISPTPPPSTAQHAVHNSDCTSPVHHDAVSGLQQLRRSLQRQPCDTEPHHTGRTAHPNIPDQIAPIHTYNAQVSSSAQLLPSITHADSLPPIQDDQGILQNRNIQHGDRNDFTTHPLSLSNLDNPMSPLSKPTQNATPPQRGRSASDIPKGITSTFEQSDLHHAIRPSQPSVPTPTFSSPKPRDVQHDATRDNLYITPTPSVPPVNTNLQFARSDPASSAPDFHTDSPADNPDLRTRRTKSVVRRKKKAATNTSSEAPISQPDGNVASLGDITATGAGNVTNPTLRSHLNPTARNSKPVKKPTAKSVPVNTHSFGPIVAHPSVDNLVSGEYAALKPTPAKSLSKGLKRSASKMAADNTALGKRGVAKSTAKRARSVKAASKKTTHAKAIPGNVSPPQKPMPPILLKLILRRGSEVGQGSQTRRELEEREILVTNASSSVAITSSGGVTNHISPVAPKPNSGKQAEKTSTRKVAFADAEDDVQKRPSHVVESQLSQPTRVVCSEPKSKIRADKSKSKKVAFAVAVNESHQNLAAAKHFEGAHSGRVDSVTTKSVLKTKSNAESSRKQMKAKSGMSGSKVSKPKPLKKKRKQPSGSSGGNTVDASVPRLKTNRGSMKNGPETVPTSPIVSRKEFPSQWEIPSPGSMPKLPASGLERPASKSRPRPLSTSKKRTRPNGNPVAKPVLKKSISKKQASYQAAPTVPESLCSPSSVHDNQVLQSEIRHENNETSGTGGGRDNLLQSVPTSTPAEETPNTAIQRENHSSSEIGLPVLGTKTFASLKTGTRNAEEPRERKITACHQEHVEGKSLNATVGAKGDIANGTDVENKSMIPSERDNSREITTPHEQHGPSQEEQLKTSITTEDHEARTTNIQSKLAEPCERSAPNEEVTRREEQVPSSNDFADQEQVNSLKVVERISSNESFIRAAEKEAHDDARHKIIETAEREQTGEKFQCTAENDISGDDGSKSTQLLSSSPENSPDVSLGPKLTINDDMLLPPDQGYAPHEVERKKLSARKDNTELCTEREALISCSLCQESIRLVESTKHPLYSIRGFDICARCRIEVSSRLKSNGAIERAPISGDPEMVVKRTNLLTLLVEEMVQRRLPSQRKASNLEDVYREIISQDKNELRRRAESLAVPFDIIPVFITLLRIVGVKLKSGSLCWPSGIVELPTLEDTIAIIGNALPRSFCSLGSEDTPGHSAWKRAFGSKALTEGITTSCMLFELMFAALGVTARHVQGCKRHSENNSSRCRVKFHPTSVAACMYRAEEKFSSPCARSLYNNMFSGQDARVYCEANDLELEHEVLSGPRSGVCCSCGSAHDKSFFPFHFTKCTDCPREFCSVCLCNVFGANEYIQARRGNYCCLSCRFKHNVTALDRSKSSRMSAAVVDVQAARKSRIQNLQSRTTGKRARVIMKLPPARKLNFPLLRLSSSTKKEVLRTKKCVRKHSSTGFAKFCEMQNDRMILCGRSHTFVNHICMACKLSVVNGDVERANPDLFTAPPTDRPLDGIVSCTVEGCKNMLHQRCMPEHEINRRRSTRAGWQCPQHKCSVCEQRDESKLVRCYTCPVAYCKEHFPRKSEVFIFSDKIIACQACRRRLEPPARAVSRATGESARKQSLKNELAVALAIEQRQRSTLLEKLIEMPEKMEEAESSEEWQKRVQSVRKKMQ